MGPKGRRILPELRGPRFPEAVIRAAQRIQETLHKPPFWALAAIVGLSIAIGGSPNKTSSNMAWYGPLELREVISEATVPVEVDHTLQLPGRQRVLCSPFFLRSLAGEKDTAESPQTAVELDVANVRIVEGQPWVDSRGDMINTVYALTGWAGDRGGVWEGWAGRSWWIRADVNVKKAAGLSFFKDPGLHLEGATLAFWKGAVDNETTWKGSEEVDGEIDVHVGYFPYMVGLGGVKQSVLLRAKARVSAQAGSEEQAVEIFRRQLNEVSRRALEDGGDTDTGGFVVHGRWGAYGVGLVHNPDGTLPPLTSMGMLSEWRGIPPETRLLVYEPPEPGEEARPVLEVASWGLLGKRSLFNKVVEGPANVAIVYGREGYELLHAWEGSFIGMRFVGSLPAGWELEVDDEGYRRWHPVYAHVFATPGADHVVSDLFNPGRADLENLFSTCRALP